MCHSHCSDIKVYYVSDSIEEIVLPIENLPELGDTQEEGIIGYILISNGEELTIITNQQEYEAWLATGAANWKVKWKKSFHFLLLVSVDVMGIYCYCYG